MKTQTLLLATMSLLAVQAVQAQVTLTVDCSREGLVGYTTANGHVITPSSRFVALPSRSVLCPNGNTTAYTVNIKYLANDGTRRTANNVPVWDVGPWSTNDTYWAANRSGVSVGTAGLNHSTIARGTSASAVGSSDKYATVANASAIDLSDYVYLTELNITWQNGLKVEVTYNWMTPTIKDNSAATFTGTSWIVASTAADKYGADYRYRSTAAVSEPATFTGPAAAGSQYMIHARWPAGANRSVTAGYQIAHSGGTTTVNCNQQANGGAWMKLVNPGRADGNWSLNAANNVKLSCWTTTGFIVVADAVKWQ